MTKCQSLCLCRLTFNNFCHDKMSIFVFVFLGLSSFISSCGVLDLLEKIVFGKCETLISQSHLANAHEKKTTSFGFPWQLLLWYSKHCLETSIKIVKVCSHNCYVFQVLEDMKIFTDESNRHRSRMWHIFCPFPGGINCKVCKCFSTLYWLLHIWPTYYIDFSWT